MGALVGVPDVADCQLFPRRIHDSIRDLDLQAQALMNIDIPTLKVEGAFWNWYVRDRGPSVEVKARCVESVYVHADRVSDGNLVSRSSECVDLIANLYSLSDFENDAVGQVPWEVLTRGSELRRASPYREQRISCCESVTVLPAVSFRITVAWAAIPTAALSVLWVWTRCVTVPVVVRSLKGPR